MYICAYVYLCIRVFVHMCICAYVYLCVCQFVRISSGVDVYVPYTFPNR